MNRIIENMILEETISYLEERKKKKKKKQQKGKKRARKSSKRKKKKKAKRDACYHKVRARYDVWPSAYASGALVKCRKVGAANWGKTTTKESKDLYEAEESIEAKIRKALMEEGGAAGMDAIVDRTGASEAVVRGAIDRMKDVKEHEHGDYYLVEEEADGVNEGELSTPKMKKYLNSHPYMEPDGLQ